MVDRMSLRRNFFATSFFFSSFGCVAWSTLPLRGSAVCGRRKHFRARGSGR